VSGALDTAAGKRTRASVEGYYRLHSKIYDVTRWTFLFGRDAVLHEIAALATPSRILEVGCGTGRNLVALARRFPQAEITGVDLSDTMLEIAGHKTASFGSRVRLAHRAYDFDFAPAASCDLILFSYALSMFNPGFEQAITAARHHLVSGGHLAIVDFHDTPWPVFARWMSVNHVRMTGQLRPCLTSGLRPRVDSVRPAYGGFWRYLIHIGRKD
jgi:S-adenosylmethionine-diacylgycerolhomoserine-N-methlytransferase